MALFVQKLWRKKRQSQFSAILRKKTTNKSDCHYARGGKGLNGTAFKEKKLFLRLPVCNCSHCSHCIPHASVDNQLGR